MEGNVELDKVPVGVTIVGTTYFGNESTLIAVVGVEDGELAAKLFKAAVEELRRG
jgi:hypothetical protein